MKKLFRVYAQAMKVHWAILLEYRGDTFFYMFGSFIFPLVTLAVWLSVSGNGDIGGYDQVEFIRYFLFVMFVARLTATWDAWEVEQNIRDGSLSGYLLRPSAYFHWRFSENLVYKIFYGLLMVAAWIIAWPFTEVVHIPLNPQFLVVTSMTILFALVIRYMLGFCTALLGFWTTRMIAITNLIELTGQFLSGRIAPMSLMPEWLQQTQYYTPFYWFLGFPVDVMSEKITGAAVWTGFMWQVFWTLLFIVLYFVLWNRGLKKYSAVGG